MPSTDDDSCPLPPEPNRVAARALVLAAVSCRGLIEKDAHNHEAEEPRLKVVGWLGRVGAAEELETNEAALLTTPLGKLGRKTTTNATWLSEGMVVLAWALFRADLPPIHTECNPIEVANAMGFLEDRENTALQSPRLRDSTEIESWAETYLTLHWRLRQFSSTPERIDFVKYVSACTWGPLRLERLEILGDDLAISGERIEKVASDGFRQTLSITQERHQAFNWLLGFERVYSQVTTDT
jgi:hypothetical protein